MVWEVDPVGPGWTGWTLVSPLGSGGRDLPGMLLNAVQAEVASLCEIQRVAGGCLTGEGVVGFSRTGLRVQRFWTARPDPGAVKGALGSMAAAP